MNTKTIRRFSVCGPCIPLGEYARETAKFFWYLKKVTGYESGVEIVLKKVGKTWDIHDEPCVSCEDHERTQYPNGYQD